MRKVTNGGPGNDRIRGSRGDDELFGNGGNDKIVGRAGDDLLDGGNGNDKLFGDSGNDTVLGGNGNDLVDAGDGDDRLSGGDGMDKLLGRRGADRMDGGDDRDKLQGGQGNDILGGGGGRDDFLFSWTGTQDRDIVKDFVSTEDRIGLDVRVFTELAIGNLPSGEFVLGTDALDADDHVIYDQTTGELFYDADGNGSGVKEIIAVLQNKPALTEADIFVF
ncbi:calcium-binding protein [Rhizobium sp. KVB221]|uniref:Calcium-binding protein n=1 Tax=Rhizobium setariae TaxID=2801340 RepID=A0A936YLD0_9HYPH|nr:calcium-binding protein [Rhizobium setariae]MBL0372448.1 calcium-binding protein [Rhizobium setariae]